MSISLSNSGTYSGNNTVTGNDIGVITLGQYYNDLGFVAGDGFNFSVTNNGVNSGTSEGGSNIGVIGSSQINFANTCSLGDSNTISISNYGQNSGNSGVTSSNILNVGNVYEQQLYVGAAFVAGDDLTLTATNEGIDSGSGSGQTYVGSINTVGSDGEQVMFDNSCSVGKNATFVVQNSGTCSGNKPGDLTNVAVLNSSQMVFNGEFQADDFLNFSITNSGIDSSHSVNTTTCGSVSSSQLLFGSTAVISDNATISIANSGTFTGNKLGVSSSYAGNLAISQLRASSDFTSGDYFNLQIENIGEDSFEIIHFNS